MRGQSGVDALAGISPGAASHWMRSLLESVFPCAALAALGWAGRFAGMRWSHLVRRAKGTGLYQAAAVKGTRRQQRQRIVGGLILLAGIVPLLLSACGPQSNSGALLAADQTFVYPYSRGDNSTTTVKDPVLDPAAIAYAADSTFTSM